MGQGESTQINLSHYFDQRLSDLSQNNSKKYEFIFFPNPSHLGVGWAKFSHVPQFRLTNVYMSRCLESCLELLCLYLFTLPVALIGLRCHVFPLNQVNK